MKTRLSFFSGLLFLSLITFSQKVNLVIFAEDGDKFYAFVNGIKQNDVAESNVKVTGVTPNISLRIEFENKALPNLKQNMALEPDFEHTAKIKRDMKKQIKLRYFGRVPLSEATNTGASTVAYHTADDSNNGNYNTTTGGSNNYTTTTTNTQVNTNTNANPNGAAVNVNVDGVSMNVNVSGMDMTNGNTVTQSSTSTTVTSSSSSTGSSPRSDHYQSQNQTTPISANGCGSAMPKSNFDSMKKSIESKPFSDTKMSTAKVSTKSNCMSVNQIKEICKLFSMDDDKLNYAKFAYDYCVDKANFYQVSEVFSFSSTADDLNAFIEKH
ncbi:MAG: DUF4476 domain-containing protein [Bacteroidetes bacterium]|nr:DUF4476 domain-containing protein [Bacteroidota bacterium]